MAFACDNTQKYEKCLDVGITHIAQLLVDLAGMYVHLHVRQADPLVQVFTVVNPTNGLLSIACGYNVKHVGRYVDFSLGLLVIVFVQALMKKLIQKGFNCLDI